MFAAFKYIFFCSDVFTSGLFTLAINLSMSLIAMRPQRSSKQPICPGICQQVCLPVCLSIGVSVCPYMIHVPLIKPQKIKMRAGCSVKVEAIEMETMLFV